MSNVSLVKVAAPVAEESSDVRRARILDLARTPRTHSTPVMDFHYTIRCIVVHKNPTVAGLMMHQRDAVKAGKVKLNVGTRDSYYLTPEQADEYVAEFSKLKGGARNLANSQAILAKVVGWTPAQVDDLRFLRSYARASAAKTNALGWISAYQKRYAA